MTMPDYRTINLKPEEKDALDATKEHLEGEIGVSLTQGEAVKLACQRFMSGIEEVPA